MTETEQWQFVRCDDGYAMVATTGDVVCHPDRNHQPGDEWDEKNFRLIAAAPDLLAALKSVVVTYKRNNPMRTADMHDLSCTCMRCAVDLADTALLKSEGR